MGFYNNTKHFPHQKILMRRRLCFTEGLKKSVPYISQGNHTAQLDSASDWQIAARQDNMINTTLLERYPTLFFCENLEDFNEARLYEATLNLHTHP